LQEFSLPIICSPDYYDLAKQGLEFLTNQEKADVFCYASKKSFKKKEKCGAPIFIGA